MKTYVLIDRSGSMQPLWPEMTNAMKKFADGIKGKIHVAVFDGSHALNYNVIHDGKVKKWDVRKSMYDHAPRAMTPLYDAVGRLAAQITTDKPKKAQIVIVTDGAENMSRENTRASVTAINQAWERLGYDVIFMGASFDQVYASGGQVGMKAGKTINMTSGETFSATMSSVAARNVQYDAGTVQGTDELSDDTRKAAGEK